MLRRWLKTLFFLTFTVSYMSENMMCLRKYTMNQNMIIHKRNLDMCMLTCTMCTWLDAQIVSSAKIYHLHSAMRFMVTLSKNTQNPYSFDTKII